MTVSAERERERERERAEEKDESIHKSYDSLSNLTHQIRMNQINFSAWVSGNGSDSKLITARKRKKGSKGAPGFPNNKIKFLIS